MKQFYSLLSACIFVSTSFCQSQKDIQQLVLEAEIEWNGGTPDKSFLSTGNSIEYGLGYLKKDKLAEALWYFDEVIKKDSNNAYANFFAGLANAGLGQFAAAETNFSKLAGVSTNLQEQAKAFLGKARQETAAKEALKNPGTTKPPAQQQNTGGTKPKTSKPTKEPAATVENKKGGNLVYGDYVFTQDYLDVSQRRMVHQQKGFFTLRANGTYSHLGATGRYSYNAATGVINWQSGTFENMGKNTTTFQRNKTTCQVDFEYETSGGKVYYSGGKNL
jgi:hypothetical protein